MAGGVEAILREMKANPAGISFADAMKLCEHYFGKPRISGGHHIFKTPWAGDPRINLQKAKNGKAKAYQIKQILLCVEQLRILGRRGI